MLRRLRLSVRDAKRNDLHGGTLMDVTRTTSSAPASTGIVLVPGFMLNRRLWTDVEPELGRFQPLVFPEIGREVSIEGEARQALRIAPPRFALIGFSMGGYIAREIARLAPERVSRLVLVATSARGDSDLQASRKLVAATATVNAYKGVSRRAIRRSLAPDRETDTDLVERIHAMSIEMGGDVFRHQAGYHRKGDEDRLHQIQCPTLVIAGEKDRLRSLDEARELRDGIPGARLATLNTGHMIPLEAPHELATLVASFLDEQV